MYQFKFILLWKKDYQCNFWSDYNVCFPFAFNEELYLTSVSLEFAVPTYELIWIDVIYAFKIQPALWCIICDVFFIKVWSGLSNFIYNKFPHWRKICWINSKPWITGGKHKPIVMIIYCLLMWEIEQKNTKKFYYTICWSCIINSFVSLNPIVLLHDLKSNSYFYGQFTAYFVSVCVTSFFY